jgi:hypothetical protein
MWFASANLSRCLTTSALILSLQVASHAQKHFLRVSSSTVRRKSRFTKIEEQVRSDILWPLLTVSLAGSSQVLNRM